MEDEPWHVKRRRELEAMAPAKRKKVEPFVKVPLAWMAAACRATNNHKALVCVALLHASWKAKSLTFPLPNGRLKRVGIGRDTKRRALRDLEQAGLIVVKWQPRKTPVVTLVLP